MTTTPSSGYDTAVTIDYTNWKGERRLRTIEPKGIFFGSSPHHPKPQWLLRAWDLEKDAERVYAMACIHNWPAPE